jgi:hypothetical protein
MLATPEFLRRLAEIVESGELEVIMIELRSGGVMMGTVKPGTWMEKQVAEQIGEKRRTR